MEAPAGGLLHSASGGRVRTPGKSQSRDLGHEGSSQGSPPRLAGVCTGPFTGGRVESRLLCVWWVSTPPQGVRAAVAPGEDPCRGAQPEPVFLRPCTEDCHADALLPKLRTGGAFLGGAPLARPLNRSARCLPGLACSSPWAALPARFSGGELKCFICQFTFCSSLWI